MTEQSPMTDWIRAQAGREEIEPPADEAVIVKPGKADSGGDGAKSMPRQSETVNSWIRGQYADRKR